MKTWITADYHLGEDRMTILGRPFGSTKEMTDVLVSNHNLLVAPTDNVIIVGDLCYSKRPEFLSDIARFNGRKTLVRGNHDAVFTDDDLRPYFDTIIPDGQGIELSAGGIDCYVTHYPTTGRVDRFNLVGHIHAAWRYQLNMFNIGVDANHFRPVDLETIPFHFKAVCDFYDKDVWCAYNPINSTYVDVRGKSGTYFNQ